MSDNTAVLAGYTRELIVQGCYQDLHIFVKPNADLDGTFKAYDADECDWITINGWMISDIEEVQS